MNTILHRLRILSAAAILVCALAAPAAQACAQRYLPSRTAGGSVAAAKPDAARIARDLVGHTLSEGLENGYHYEGWTWRIDPGEIRDLAIAKVLQNDKGTYRVEVSMKIMAAYYHYDTRAEVGYTLSPRGEWQFDYVLSRGMRIAATHNYDNCIGTAIVEDGWGGTYCLSLRNNSELRLVVGGSLYAGGEWRHFSQIVEPHSQKSVGGLFMGGSVESYRIEFIVREQ
ncbi:MAG: hypothetical protein J6K38_07705 [Alistipes sp.]|nr:hypothetical protein [Alistipes sp.]